VPHFRSRVCLSDRIRSSEVCEKGRARSSLSADINVHRQTAWRTRSSTLSWLAAMTLLHHGPAPRSCFFLTTIRLQELASGTWNHQYLLKAGELAAVVKRRHPRAHIDRRRSHSRAILTMFTGSKSTNLSGAKSRRRSDPGRIGAGPSFKVEPPQFIFHSWFSGRDLAACLPIMFRDRPLRRAHRSLCRTESCCESLDMTAPRVRRRDGLGH